MRKINFVHEHRSGEAAMQTQEALSDYEKERGKPMPSKLHSLIQKRLLLALARYEPPYAVFPELTIELEGQPFTPDLSVYRREDVDFEREEIRMTEPPLLTFEIISPTQGVQTLIDKIEFMLGHGVRSAWLVQPMLETVTVFTEGMQKRTISEGTVSDPVTEVEVTLSDIFAMA